MHLLVESAFFCGVWWGPVGVAISYAIVNYLILYPSLLIAFKDTSLLKRDFFIPLMRPATASICGALVVMAFSSVLSGFSLLGFLILSTLGFASTYLLVFLCLPGGRLEILEILALRRHLAFRRSTNT